MLILSLSQILMKIAEIEKLKFLILEKYQLVSFMIKKEKEDLQKFYHIAKKE